MARPPAKITTYARYLDYQGQQFLDENGVPVTGPFFLGYTTFRFYNGYLHCYDEKPAVETSDAHLEFWYEGFLHRTDGPAVYTDGGRIYEFWVNGIRTEDDGTGKPVIPSR